MHWLLASVLAEVAMIHLRGHAACVQHTPGAKEAHKQQKKPESGIDRQCCYKDKPAHRYMYTGPS